jgi:catechol 2,3-dioxygenase-like lactoylglutathione lyase family enzyme
LTRSTEAVALQIKAVVETAIYVDDLEAAESFYGTVLGLKVIGTELGRHVFFQVGEASVLLAFLADATLRDVKLPVHGTSGPGHIGLGIEADEFDAWRTFLQGHGVIIEKEVEWPRGGSQFTFVTLPEIRWNWSRLGCGDCRVGGDL